MSWAFSLDQLPVWGLTDSLASVELTRGRLLNTLTIIDGVLKIPAGLPSELRQSIHNVRFHVAIALSLVDGYISAGHSIREPASGIDGLQVALSAHVAALREARPLWQAFKAQALGADDEWLRLAAAPVPPASFVGAGLATAGLFRLPQLGDEPAPPSPERVYAPPAPASAPSAASGVVALLVVGAGAWLVTRMMR